MKIHSNVYLIPGVTAHPYLLIDTDGLTLIDAGIPGIAKIILRYIRHLGYSHGDLKRILVTHADYDHAGSLAALKKASGARVHASASEAKALAVGRFPRSLQTDHFLLKPVFQAAEHFGRITPVQVDEILTEGQVLPILGGLCVVASAGHTPGHLSLFLPSAGILFTGDSILHRQNRLSGSRGAVTWDQDRADQAVRRQAALKARIICPGHGSVLLDAVGKFPLHRTGNTAPLIPLPLETEIGGD